MGEDDTRTADERLLLGAPVFAPPAASAPEAITARGRRRFLPAISLPKPGSEAWPVQARAALRRAFDYELEHGNTFLFVPVFLAAGALWYFTAAHEPDVMPLLLGAGFAAVLAMLVRGRPALRAAFLAILLTVAGVLAAKMETWRAGTKMLGAEITTVMTARVARIEHQASGRARLTLDVLATERPELRYSPERVRATARTIPQDLRPGHVLRGVARLMPASGPVRPLSYDFSFRSYFDDIGAVGFFLSGPDLAEGDWPAPSLATRTGAWIEGWRQRMAGRIEATIGGAEGAIAAALITGIRAGIPEEINEALRIVGLYHVISISGLHMALVAGTLMVALRCGFALAPSFSMRRPVKKYAAAVALLATGFYLMISGGDVAAQRSFLMLAVMLLAVMCDRAALTMRNLAISAIIILLVSPHEVVGPSFQMSFAATAALVAAYAAWTGRRERRAAGPAPGRGIAAASLRTGVRYAAGLSMTSVVAGLATAIFTAWHFQQVSPMGLFANLAAMPVVSVVVMPMAVLASLLMPLGLDGPPLFLMGQGIALMNAIAAWLAERSAFDATGAIPLGAVLSLTAALAILTMAGSRLRWTAVPLAMTGVALLTFSNAVPDVLVSEDGRLVAMRLSDGRVAVNRARPRDFTMQNWQRALGSDDIVRPRKAQDIDAGAGEGEEAGFICAEDGLCLARHAGGAVVTHAPNAAVATKACGLAGLVVIDDATARNPCAAGGTLVVTKRDLARRGSAEIILDAMNSGRMTEIRFAIPEPYRPWHDHRRFSREARGLAPWQRRERQDSPPQ